MKRSKRILVAAGCVLLLLVSWLAALTAESDAERQQALMDQTAAYLEDEIYILSVPLLEEAIGYDGPYTAEAEEQLKEVYRQLFHQSGYRDKYESLLAAQMARSDAGTAPFLEAATYYLDISDLEQALAVLRDGIAKTGSAELTALYEEHRYAFTFGRTAYEEVTAIYNGAIQVALGGRWGLADAGGALVIPCNYDQISTYSDGRVIVLSDGVLSAIDTNENRLALFHGEAEGISNLAEDRLAIQTADGWLRANSSLAVGTERYEEIGMYSGGYAAACQNGRWGVMDTGGQWVLPPEYDDIVRDELGRCWAQGAVFVRQGDRVYLLVDGVQVGEAYEDARPFADGFAAVRRDGLWGFIDTTGTVRIPFQFDDAQSFGQHLAAVRQGDLWGYVSVTGEMAIPPQFLEAKGFSGGSAPVQTTDGWQFITLVEYQEGSGL